MNDPKLTLNTIRPEACNLCITNVTGSQISLHFALFTANHFRVITPLI